MVIFVELIRCDTVMMVFNIVQIGFCKNCFLTKTTDNYAVALYLDNLITDYGNKLINSDAYGYN